MAAEEGRSGSSCAFLAALQADHPEFRLSALLRLHSQPRATAINDFTTTSDKMLQHLVHCMAAGAGAPGSRCAFLAALQADHPGFRPSALKRLHSQPCATTINGLTTASDKTLQHLIPCMAAEGGRSGSHRAAARSRAAFGVSPAAGVLLSLSSLSLYLSLSRVCVCVCVCVCVGVWKSLSYLRNTNGSRPAGFHG